VEYSKDLLKITQKKMVYKSFQILLSKQNINRLSTDWQQIWSENVSRLTSIAVPFCFRSVDRTCSHSKTADWQQKSSRTCGIWIWRQKSSRICCFYRYLNCDVIATEKSSKITFSILFILK